jgi:hypothetical protein
MDPSSFIRSCSGQFVPTATFNVSGPVALGAPVRFTCSSPSGGSGFRYSFDFNNDGDCSASFP